jgi:hypothetical protein
VVSEKREVRDISKKQKKRKRERRGRRGRRGKRKKVLPSSCLSGMRNENERHEIEFHNFLVSNIFFFAEYQLKMYKGTF